MPKRRKRKMKRKIAYTFITSALVMSAFLIGKTAHQPSIPVDDVAAYYIDSNGNLNLEMKDVRCIEDNWDNPIYTNYLAEQGISDITAQMENNILNLASVTDYEATETTLTLTDRNGDSWVIEK